jgi:hypothetical protein
MNRTLTEMTYREGYIASGKCSVCGEIFTAPDGGGTENREWKLVGAFAPIPPGQDIPAAGKILAIAWHPFSAQPTFTPVEFVCKSVISSERLLSVSLNGGGVFACISFDRALVLKVRAARRIREAAAIKLVGH